VSAFGLISLLNGIGLISFAWYVFGWQAGLCVLTALCILVGASAAFIRILTTVEAPPPKKIKDIDE
jgi:hypothetical protein